MTILEKYKSGELTVKEFLDAGYRFEVGDLFKWEFRSGVSKVVPLTVSALNKSRYFYGWMTVVKSAQLNKKLWHQKAINYLSEKDGRSKNSINIYGISITEQEWKEFARLILWEKYDHL